MCHPLTSTFIFLSTIIHFNSVIVCQCHMTVKYFYICVSFTWLQCNSNTFTSSVEFVTLRYDISIYPTNMPISCGLAPQFCPYEEAVHIEASWAESKVNPTVSSSNPSDFCYYHTGSILNQEDGEVQYKYC